MDQAKDKELNGLGGWLVLVILMLVVAPLRIGRQLVTTHLPIFSDGSWQLLTDPASESYHALWAPLLTFEIVGNLMSITLAVITLVFVLMKSKYAPVLALTWLGCGFMVVVGDFFLAELIPAIATQPNDPETVREMTRAVVSTAIWVPYFLVSKRVKATFTREWPGKAPVQTALSPAA